MRLLACVQVTICATERDKRYERPAMFPCPGQIFLPQGEGEEELKRAQEMIQHEQNSVSMLCPTGPELGGWQGSHYMCVYDSSLSLRQQIFNTTTLTPQLCNADYIITHPTQFSGCFDVLCIRGLT